MAIGNILVSLAFSGGGNGSNVDPNNKGIYATLSALQTAIPSPSVGFFAFIETPISQYVCYTAGTWTLVSGGGPNIYTYSAVNETHFVITHNKGKEPVNFSFNENDLGIIDFEDLEYSNSLDLNTVSFALGEPFTGTITIYF